ncbi:terminase family protein [Desulfovibrio sp. JY]|nr:terminase family protein [Desulfovibrio sp. JY]
MNVQAEYRPLPKQAALHASPANEILYGGAAGPGKSHALRMEGLHWCMRIPGLNVYLFRRTFPELEKNHILPSQAHFPMGVGTFKSQAKRWDFVNGSKLFFASCQYEQDVFAFQGAEIHLLLIDELTTFTEFQYDYLRGRLRCALVIPERYRHKIPGIVCASNPGGVGHAFAKRRWVDFVKPMQLKMAAQEEGGMLRTYIPGLLQDNPILMQRDPGYLARLDALPEPYRTAYKDGNWDIFIGQAFEFSRARHVVKPMPIPEHAPLYMTFDWGYGAPFALGWWWEDADGRLYRFGEWYGWNGTPNQGMRLVDSEIAKGILQREERWGLKGRPIVRLAGPDCFSKKPDYRGGGQGPSTAEEFAKEGVDLTPGDPSRVTKIRRFRERLMLPKDDSAPMLLVYESCEQFIRTIPLLQIDPLNVEDIDTTGEDHIYDEACHVCMLRAPAGDGLTAGANWGRKS